VRGHRGRPRITDGGSLKKIGLKMTSRRSGMRYGQLTGCLTHKRKRTFKTQVSKPTNKCLICWLCWLADRTESMLYADDIEDIIRFSNAFPGTLKPSSIEFVEEAPDES